MKSYNCLYTAVYMAVINIVLFGSDAFLLEGFVIDKPETSGFPRNNGIN